MRSFNKTGWPYSGISMYTNEHKCALTCGYVCIKESNDIYHWLLLSQAEMEPRWSVFNIRLTFADGFLSDQLLVGLGRSDTRILKGDYYHLMNEI